MNIFGKKKKTADPIAPDQTAQPIAQPSQSDPIDRGALCCLALDAIADGALILNSNNQIQLINPAGASMLGYDADGIINLDVAVILHFQTPEGLAIEEPANQVLHAIQTGTAFTTRDYVLVNAQGQNRPVSISVTPVSGHHGEKIVTFRDISKELEEEGAQTEFISTASHEMRTPVASIEGYLALALNPSCATIDDRARKYLEDAHASSQHLGHLFRDLLDVTRLDDKKLKIHPVAVEMTKLVREIVEGQLPAFNEKKIRYTFGSNNMGDSSGGRSVKQETYAYVDVDFLREVINNLVENAIKYNNEGGGIWVNVRGDGDRVLINITDTGIGISPDDLKHIFQKFYRADNSQTRTIGGTGLGLYLVRERVEAMGGKVWAESSFGEGSTFYISFPRLTWEEYERRKQVAANSEAMQAPAPAQNPTTEQPNPAQPAPSAEQPTPPAGQPAPQPVAPVQPAPTPSAPDPSMPVQQPIMSQPDQPVAQPNQAPQPAPQPVPAPAPQPQPNPVQPPQPIQTPVFQSAPVQNQPPTPPNAQPNPPAPPLTT